MDSFSHIGLTHFLVLSLLMVAAGVATILSKRNAIGILIGVELVLNAAAVNLVAFNRFAWPRGADSGPAVDGVTFAVFIVVLAASEAAVALAVFLNYYSTFRTVDVEEARELKG